jgi:hypothetical protein
MSRYDTSSRVHIIVLYLLIACLTILWGIFFIYYSTTVRAQVKELNRIKQRLSELEATQITISSAINEADALERQSRRPHLKSKLLDKQQQQQQDEGLNALFGSIHFKVPVRKKKIFK